MRTYERTHPWLSFSVNLKAAPPRFWIALGECQSKCKYIASVPLRPSTAEQLYQLYLAKGSQGTTAIEGNTLSEEEVLRHLKGELKLPPSKEYLAQEIDNIVEGCNQILAGIRSGSPLKLDANTIRQLNRTVLDKLPPEEDVWPGEIRKHSVVVALYRGAPAEDCEYLLDHLCTWLNGEHFAAPDGMELSYAILKAILAHLYLAWVHPFGNGNGRTARLIEFMILIASGVPAPATHILSNHYNQTRSEYYRQLDAASRSGGDVLPFIMYAVQGLMDGLTNQLEIIRQQQWDVAWRSYVHQSFSNQSGPTVDRRRRLVLDLSRKDTTVPLSELSEISPRIAKAYARKTYRTLNRDVSALVSMGLVAYEKGGYRARKEAILAFLPLKAEVEQTDLSLFDQPVPGVR
ncbi:MAG: Fic family protein [Pseudomonadota bacterium]